MTSPPGRSRLLHAPWWVIVLVAGIPFGLAMGLFAGIGKGTTAAGLLAGVGGGLAFGLCMAVLLDSANRRTRRAMGPVPPWQELAVLRAARRGPVPPDPAVRAAALRVATDQLAQLTRLRRPAQVGFGLVAVLQAIVAILSGNPWSWLWAAVFAGYAVAVVPLVERRVQRRIALLQNSAS